MEDARRKYYIERELHHDDLKKCGLRLIKYLMKEFQGQRSLRTLVNEILHSIFFLGSAHDKPFTPEDILSDGIYKIVKQQFPEPFEKYKTHLPRRTPFSGLLEIMELKYDSTEKVIEGLCSLMKELEFPQHLKIAGSTKQHFYTLEAAAICACSKDSHSPKTYFGASVGSKPSKRIMIYSSCISDALHDYVSHAVMSFNNHKDDLKTPGDRLKFPESVQCQAYLWKSVTKTYEKIPPCWNCQHIFNLPGPPDEKEKSYPYGNCAETECLSKLLLNDQSVREGTVINNHTDDTLSNLKESTKKKLRTELSKRLASKPAFRNMLKNKNLLFFNPSA